MSDLTKWNETVEWLQEWGAEPGNGQRHVERAAEERRSWVDRLTKYHEMQARYSFTYDAKVEGARLLQDERCCRLIEACAAGHWIALHLAIALEAQREELEGDAMEWRAVSELRLCEPCLDAISTGTDSQCARHPNHAEEATR